jgi:prepilin-type N-terminal cleavage/methylation domain-containing protein
LRHMTRRGSGFTLIEIMVVIALLAGLYGMGTLVIHQAKRKQAEMVTRQRLQSVGAALELLKDSSYLGHYPVTLTSALSAPDDPKFGAKVGMPNATNVGSETLYVVFRMNGMPRPEGMDTEEAVGNTDEDQADALAGDMAVRDLLEYVDAWGNPLVYVHSRDYKDMKAVERYVLGEEYGRAEVKVQPLRVEKTGEYFRPTTFQLFSMGPDGVPGTEDDIHYGR